MEPGTFLWAEAEAVKMQLRGTLNNGEVLW
jgi:hypothetical protein